MKQGNISRIYIGIMSLSLSLGASQKCFSPGEAKIGSMHRAVYQQFSRMAAPEQVLAIGIARQIMKNVRFVPVKLGRQGEIPSSCLLRMNDVGSCSLYHSDTGFSEGPESMCSIPRENVDDTLSQLDSKSMCHFLALNKIGVSRGSDRALLLRAHMMGKGGGWWLANGVDWAISLFIGSWAANATQRGLAKALDVVDGLCQKEVGSGMFKVLTDTEMVEAGYYKIYEGAWIAKKTLNGISSNIDEAIRIACRAGKEVFYTRYQAIPPEKWPKNVPIGVAIDYAVAHSPFFQFQDFIVNSAPVKKVAETVKSAASGAKKAIEENIGGNLFNDKIQDVATGAFKSGAMSVAVNVGLKLGCAAVNYVAGGNDYGFDKAEIGVATVGDLTLSDKALDKNMENVGLLMASGASCFFWGATRYALRQGLYYTLLAVPGP